MSESPQLTRRDGETGIILGLLNAVEDIRRSVDNEGFRPVEEAPFRKGEPRNAASVAVKSSVKLCQGLLDSEMAELLLDLLGRETRVAVALGFVAAAA